MDLPSVCPLCDSERVNCTFLSPGDADAPGTLVFSCPDCGSYVESLLSDLDATTDDCPSIPAPRLQPHGQPDDDKASSPAPGWSDIR